MTKIVLIIETSDVGARHTAEAIKSLGYIPIFICKLSHYQADTLSQIKNYQYFDSDTSSVEKILETVKKNINPKDIIGVVSLADSKLSIASELAKYFNVSGIDPAISILCDKGKVSQLIPEFSPVSLIFNRQNIPREIENLLAENHKIVVKPTQSAAAVGMFTVNNEQEFKQIHDLMIDNCAGNKKLLEGEWIAQPMKEGRLVSLEGYVLQSKVNFIGYTGRKKIGKTESVSEFPFDSHVSSLVRKKSCEAISALVERSKFENGYFHTEFIMTDQDCFLIDANFGRIGGGGIAQQVAISYNKVPEDIYKHVISVGIFKGGNLNSPLYESKPVESLSINYGIRTNGILKKLSLPGNTHKEFIHTLLLDPGSEVSAMGKDDYSWLGIAVGLADKLPNDMEKIFITTDKGTESSFYLEDQTIRNNQTVSNKDKLASDAKNTNGILRYGLFAGMCATLGFVCYKVLANKDSGVVRMGKP